jgi:hypothetical protein
MAGRSRADARRVRGYLRRGTQFRSAAVAEDEPLVAELFRRCVDDGATIADLAPWLTSQGMPTRTGKHCLS